MFWDLFIQIFILWFLVCLIGVFGIHNFFGMIKHKKDNIILKQRLENILKKKGIKY